LGGAKYIMNARFLLREVDHPFGECHVLEENKLRLNMKLQFAKL
jgi:hypothetical protein